MNEPSRGRAEWITGDSRTLYSSRWLDLQLVEVTPPGGLTFEHHVVRMQRVAVCLVLNEKRNSVLMLRRHRFIDDSWGWEVPIGIVEPGEEPDVAAAREVEEETGWRPRRLVHQTTFQPAIGIADSPHDVFLSTSAEHLGAPTDGTEADEIEWVATAELLPMINRGTIRDGATLVAVLHLLVSGHGAEGVQPRE